VNRWNSLDLQKTVDIAPTHSRAGLIKSEKNKDGFLWILRGRQSHRTHGDGTPVRPHKVSHKMSFGCCYASQVYTQVTAASALRRPRPKLTDDFRQFLLSEEHFLLVFRRYVTSRWNGRQMTKPNSATYHNDATGGPQPSRRHAHKFGTV